ncbi:TetR/AcrR family transcriptional regulator [Methylobacterium sp. GC_Met_2]|uniref:TetR/AcrR family transcriptional regulator n=1 Tax=Methylobacterium sp. GC_Met_2 TaxID=2937376 RepID=UPI00226B1FF4|nr:TetR/AcrR family transcriptional regulator [Methylobacterium sp. GC_Met_2]
MARVDESDPTYARLIAAARAEFLNQGFAGATVASIAANAGISKKTVYQYAASKEALMYEVVSEACQELFSPIFNSGGADLARSEIARCLVKFCLLSTSEDGVTIHRLAIGEARQFPNMAQAYKHALNAYVLEPLAAWVGWQNEFGRLRADDPRLAADMLTSMVVSPYMRDLSLGVRPRPSREEVERVVNTALNLFYAGCATRMYDDTGPEGSCTAAK